MQFKLRLVLATMATAILAACGGGSATAPTTKTPTSGVAVDGYVKYATVTCDANGNGIADDSESHVYTDASGNFTFPNGCASGLLVSGGTSLDTGLPFVGLLKAPAGAKVASPLTTLLVAGMTQAQINTSLGLPAGTDLLNTDPGLTDGSGALVNADLMKKTLAVQQLLQKATEGIAGLAGAAGSAAVQPIYSEVAAAFATQLQGGAKLNSSTTTVDVTVVKSLISAAAQRVASATDVIQPVRTALAGVSSAALAEVISTALKTQTDAILQATNTASLTAVTRDNQGSDVITSFVHDNASQLSGTQTTATLSALSASVTQQVVAASAPAPAPSGTVLLSFDEAAPAFTNMGAYGDALPSVAAGPSGGNGNALKILKPVSAVTWGGVYFGVNAIPFTANRKVITARVYSTRAAAVIKFKVQMSDVDFVEVASAPTGAANSWSTLSWDMSAISTSKAYTVIAITPDADTVTSGQSYYIDDIALAPASATTPPTTTSFALSFDEAVAAFSNMGAYGDALPSVVAGPTGGSGNALKIVKPVSAVTWGGVYFTVNAIPFSADRKTISARVYSTRADAVIKFKVQVSDVDFVEVASAPTGTANTWSTVTWDLSAVSTSKAYTVIAITPDADAVTSGQSYYIDDITLMATPVSPAATAPTTAAATPTALAANVLSIYSDAYTPVAGINLNPGWGQSTVATTVTIAGNLTQKYATLNYQGIDFVGHAIDVSAMTKLHIDVWTPDLAALKISLISTATGGENPVTLNPTLAGWNSFDIDLSGYTAPDKTRIDQIKFDVQPATGTLYFDNLYFWKPASTATDYLALAGNALSLSSGTSTVSFSMADFQSAAGINLRWPVAANATINFNLNEVGSFNLAAGQKLTAAVQISETRAGGLGEIRGYIDNVSITKTGSSIRLTVPNPADALMYGVSGDGTKKAVINFANSVSGITNVLTAAAGTLNSILVGDVINYAVNQVSNDFTGIYSLRGKYKLTIVVTDLPLRTTDGSKFPTYTILVPTTIGADGTPGNINAVTGSGLEGYITLTD